MTNTDWMSEAACAGHDTSVYFAEANSTKAERKATQTAKEDCAACPVKAECLLFALTAEAGIAGDRYGIYGGLTGLERSRLAAKK